MATRGDDPKTPDPTRVSGALIGLLGVVSIVGRLPFASAVDGLTAMLITIALPSSLGIILLGVGYWTARGGLVAPAEAPRLVGWVVAGMVVFLFVGVWIVVLDVLLGQPVPFGSLLTVNAVTLGGVVGAGIGLYDAQSREYTRRVEEREQTLAEQNQRLDEFVSIVSHDLRNPLTVAKGRLDLAREECASEQLEHVARAHDRMAALIDDMLELSHQAEATTDVEAVDLAAVCATCWQHVETAAATLVTETDAVIRADRNRLQQLLENLLRNAVEHSGENVTVTIGDLEDGFYVADDGSGIPEARRSGVLDAGYTTNEDGTGFGLRIVKQVADAHNWEICVNEGADGGARFEVTGVEFAPE